MSGGVKIKELQSAEPLVEEQFNGTMIEDLTYGEQRDNNLGKRYCYKFKE